MRLFDRETHATSVADGKWRIEAPAEWSITGNTNGGWIMAVATRSALEALPHGDPAVVSGFYTSPVAAGDIEVDTAVLSVGRGTSFATAEVRQDDRLCGHFGIAATDFEHLKGDSFETRRPPELPAWDDCIAIPRENSPGMETRVSQRFNPEQDWWNPDRVRGATGYECWLAHADGAELAALDMLMFVDCVPPAVFSMLGMVGWVPTVELTVQVRRRPQGKLLRAQVSSRSLSAGLVEEEVELWDESDQLVALSRQMLKVRKAQ